MTQNEWPARLARTIAKEVQRRRNARGMSAQELANACEALGVPLSRSAIANFESGRRPSISVAELLVFARALDVPPALLVFPLGIEEEVEVPPGETIDTWEAVRWFGGDHVKGLSADADATIVEDYRWHDDLVQRWRSTQEELNRLILIGGPENDELIAANNRLLGAIRQNLMAGRKRMRSDGMKLPKLPAALADPDAE
ncbi:helix-turn-helix domain-containing protein [Nonomuraea terrae]|uniref:helix-turn-helix domain-containing protein n=1 Tax=Nonomuraea terrae TaxID=2530383 RepID=UPI0037BB8872